MAKGPEVTKARKNLRYEFTSEEMLQLGKEQAREQAEAEEIDERLAHTKKQMQADIDAHVARQKSINIKINNGYEYRDIDVEISRDFNHGTVTITRLTTKEIVEESPMRDDERQLALDGAE